MEAPIHSARVGWGLFGCSVAIYGLLSLTLHMPFVFWNHPDYFDLNVYRDGVLAVVHGHGLYARPVYHGYWFTYPPFAAMLLWPTSLAPVKVIEPIVTTLNIAGVVWLMRRTLMLGGVASKGAGEPAEDALSTATSTREHWASAAFLAAFALWLEPVALAIGYGQVDVLIALLVVIDLTRPLNARGSGILIGLATAIKLTPVLFIVYLAACGRLRAARNACLTFLASIALAYAVLGSDASKYWSGGLFLSSKHIGTSVRAIQESLRGLLIKLGFSPTGVSWMAVAIPIGALGLLLAVRAGRRGDAATGFSLAALTSLLCSPISWSHHWVLAVPALVIFTLRGWARRSRRMLIAAALMAAIAYAYIPELAGRHDTWNGINLLWADPYVLVGVVVLLVVAGQAVKEWHAKPRAGRTVSPAAAPVVRESAR